MFLEKRINENSCSFVGLSNAILLAQHNKVVIYDIVPAKVDLINSRKSPFVDKEIEAFLFKDDLDFVQSLESALGIKAKKNFMPMQAGDVYQTFADIDDLFNVTGYKPKMSVEQGVNNFVDWYREFYG